jgi:hypothetical protein
MCVQIACNHARDGRCAQGVVLAARKGRDELERTADQNL